MQLILYTLLYSLITCFTAPTPVSAGKGKAAALDSIYTECAKASAIRIFAGKEIYYGKVVEYTSYVMAPDTLLIRYKVGLNGDVLWVNNSVDINNKKPEYKISIRSSDGGGFNTINKNFMLLNLITDSIHYGSYPFNNIACLKLYNKFIMNKMHSDVEVYYYTLNFIFLRFMYAFSETIKIPKEYSRIDYVAQNQHLPVRYIQEENEICVCDSIRFCQYPLKMEIFQNQTKLNPDTAIVYFPCPERYFENIQDSFKIQSVVLRDVYSNNRYEIDTSDTPKESRKYVFMGFSNEVIKLDKQD